MKQRKRDKNRQMGNPAELSKYAEIIRPAIERVIRELGFHLAELLFVNENQENYLRLTVMHEDRSVSLNDCETISKKVSKELDLSDPIPFSYMLEVQSRGVDTVPMQEVGENTQNQRHEFVLEKIGLTVRS